VAPGWTLDPDRAQLQARPGRNHGHGIAKALRLTTLIGSAVATVTASAAATAAGGQTTRYVDDDGQAGADCGAGATARQAERSSMR
jgi:hypothetical protein